MCHEATTVYEKCLANVSLIGKVVFNHCSRDVNEVAHVIARECFTSKKLVIGSMSPIVLFCKL
jgi:hypothetical protein